MTPSHYLRATGGIVAREGLRFLHQRERFIAALVRPLVWLVVFAAGFRTVFDVTAVAPYGAAVPYDVYVVPGLIGMTQLFNGMQSSLSMVYDREMGGMRVLLVSPLPRWYLLFSKLLAGTAVSLIQVYAFVVIALAFGIDLPLAGLVAMLPALLLSGLMLGALGLLLSSVIRQLENFAGVMNFVIFPMFFLSTALYPLSRMADANAVLYAICAVNPFTHAVELIRHALYLQVEPLSLLAVLVAFAVFAGGAVYGYDPARGLIRRRGGPAGD